mmetsp:Transcript_65833/g.185289  ORF Transcript_65833/g.185289 Transcript_65833/m.185289 type:complete len:310 (+) Transcript_65833:219-1148(+)
MEVRAERREGQVALRDVQPLLRRVLRRRVMQEGHRRGVAVQGVSHVVQVPLRVVREDHMRAGRQGLPQYGALVGVRREPHPAALPDPLPLVGVVRRGVAVRPQVALQLRDGLVVHGWHERVEHKGGLAAQLLPCDGGQARPPRSEAYGCDAPRRAALQELRERRLGQARGDARVEAVDDRQALHQHLRGLHARLGLQQGHPPLQQVLEPRARREPVAPVRGEAGLVQVQDEHDAPCPALRLLQRRREAALHRGTELRDLLDPRHVRASLPACRRVGGAGRHRSPRGRGAGHPARPARRPPALGCRACAT